MHIIIAGTARAGKTTLSLMLKDKGYVHYKMDSFKRGMCKAYNLKYDDWEPLSLKMAIIMNQMILDNKTDIVYEKENYLFDIPFLYPKDVELINTEDTIVIFLGYAYLTAEENFANIRKYDSDNSFTSKASDEQLMIWCKQNVEHSRYLKAECERLNIKYFDTSVNRDEVLKDAIKYIEEEERKFNGRNSK